MTVGLGLLDGIKVIEAGGYLTIPLAATLLGELGAEVIKVEPPGGDPFRSFGYRHQGLSASWVNANHHKQVVTLDLKTDAGRESMSRLLDGADVFLHNWRPEAAKKLGLGPSHVRGSRPSLVYLSVSGFGPAGPRSGGPVFDSLIQAVTGLSVLEASSKSPTLVRSYVVDKVTASYVVQAVLAALLRRERAYEGATLDLAMFDVMAHFNFVDLFQLRTFLEADTKEFSPAPQPAILPTADGHVSIAPVRGSDVLASIEVVGHPEWRADLRAIDGQAELMRELVSRLSKYTIRMSTEECVLRFAANGVPISEVITPDGHLTDAQTQFNQLYGVAMSEVGPVRRVRYPLIVDSAPVPGAERPEVRAPS